jgi:hypothetical protein
MSTAGGGAAQVIVDILANATGLGTTLQQAEKQVEASAQRMGKTMDNAVGQTVGGRGRLGQMFAGKGAMVGGVATAFAQSFTDDLKKETERRSDLGDSLAKGLRESLKVIPHWSVQLGLVLAEALEPVGERAGEALGRAMFEGTNMEIENRFEEGSEYGLGDWMSDFFANRTTREIGRGIVKIPNQNLILGRMDELAALQAEQQILNMTDVRGQMIQSRMHMGMAEFQTGMGTFRAAFGTPEEASAKVYDAAMKQVVALERIESIVKEIGHYSRTAMRN